MKKTEKVVFAKQTFDTVLTSAKGCRKFDIAVGGNDMEGLSLTAYPQGGYVRLSKNLYEFMKKPKYVHLYGNGSLLTLVIVPEKKESPLTWSLKQQTDRNNHVYDKGACLYSSGLAKLLGGYSDEGKKVTLEAREGSTPDHVIIPFASAFGGMPD